LLLLLLLLAALQTVLAAWMLTDLLHCTDTARAVCTQPALLLWPPCPRQSGLAASPAEFAADAAAACPARCTHQYQRNILVMMAAEHLWQVKICQTSEQSAELRNLGLDGKLLGAEPPVDMPPLHLGEANGPHAAADAALSYMHPSGSQWR